MENLQDVIKLGSKLDILYVEDDQPLLEETRDIFEKIFRSVESASSGSEGILKFSQKRYDMVVTDIEMPGLNGLEMSEKIKEIAPEIPIVIISAYSNSSYLIEAINIGINYYILKPILLPQLLSTLGSVVRLVEDRRVAHECHQKEIAVSIRDANEKLFTAMTKSSPNPIVICDGRHVSFYNEAFEDLFEERELRDLKEKEAYLLEFLEQKIAVDQLFKSDESFVKVLRLEMLEEDHAIRLSLKTKLGTRIYMMFKNNLQINVTGQMQMFTFNDITQLSFQSVQLEKYDKVIGELTHETYKNDESSLSDSIINKTSFEVE